MGNLLENSTSFGFAFKSIHQLKWIVYQELEKVMDEKDNPIDLSEVFKPFSTSEILLAPNLLVRASVTNTTPNVCKYKYPSIPEFGNIANVSNTGNAFTIDLESRVASVLGG